MPKGMTLWTGPRWGLYLVLMMTDSLIKMPRIKMPFIKMHALGNDFVVIDARNDGPALKEPDIRALAERRSGIGCDQVIIIEPASDDLALIAMRIFNADGGAAGACGNAARCVAAWLMDQSDDHVTDDHVTDDHVTIETPSGIIDAHRSGEQICVDMGRPHLAWRDIPLASAADTLHCEVGSGVLRDACVVNMGNPHAVFFVADVAAIDLETLGPIIEQDALFPERTNVEVAEIMAADQIRLRVWERGVGLTPACGSGACATLVAAHRRGLSNRKAAIMADGGRLDVTWTDDDHVLLTGPATISFTGCVEMPVPEQSERIA